MSKLTELSTISEQVLIELEKTYPERDYNKFHWEYFARPEINESQISVTHYGKHITSYIKLEAIKIDKEGHIRNIVRDICKEIDENIKADK